MYCVFATMFVISELTSCTIAMAGARAVVVARAAQADVNFVVAVATFVAAQARAHVIVEPVRADAMHAARHIRAVRLPLGAVLTEIVLGASALVSVGADDLISGFARGSIFARKAGAFVDVQLTRVKCAGGEARPADAVIPIHALPAPRVVLAWPARALVDVLLTRGALPAAGTAARALGRVD